MNVEDDFVPDECYACGYKTEVQPYDVPPGYRGEEKKLWYCYICAHTFISNTIAYPGQDSGGTVLRTIGWVSNMLSEKMDKILEKLNEK